jgi:hypothetical protein
MSLVVSLTPPPATNESNTKDEAAEDQQNSPSSSTKKEQNIKATKDFEHGTVVWAKLKGFPAWPAKILNPENLPYNLKYRRDCYPVVFYGQND